MDQSGCNNSHTVRCQEGYDGFVREDDVSVSYVGLEVVVLIENGLVEGRGGDVVDVRFYDRFFI